MYPAGDVGVVEGEMNIPSRGVPSGDSMEFNTLDEPIKETFVCDLCKSDIYEFSITQSFNIILHPLNFELCHCRRI